MTSGLNIWILLLLALHFACAEPDRHGKSTGDAEKPLKAGDYWVKNFESGHYPGKTFFRDKVYCTSILSYPSPTEYFYCFDLPSGKVDWVQPVSVFQSGVSFVSDSIILYISHLKDVYAFHPSGKWLWSSEDGGGELNWAVDPVTGHLFTLSLMAGVKEIDLPTGRVMSVTGEGNVYQTMPVFYKDLIIYGGQPGADPSAKGNVLRCTNRNTGDTVWEKSFNDVHSLAGYNGRLYFNSDETKLNCLNILTGDVLWQTSVKRHFDAGILFDDSTLYFKTSNDQLCFDPETGEQKTWHWASEVKTYHPQDDSGRVYNVAVETGEIITAIEAINKTTCKITVTRK